MADSGSVRLNGTSEQHQPMTPASAVLSRELARRLSSLDTSSESPLQKIECQWQKIGMSRDRLRTDVT